MAFIYSLNCFPKSLQGVSFYTQMLKKAHRYSLLIDAYVSTDRHWQFCNSMFADACNKMKIYEASGKHAF